MPQNDLGLTHEDPHLVLIDAQKREKFTGKIAVSTQQAHEKEALKTKGAHLVFLPFHDATLIEAEVLKHIEGCTPLAPLHNPTNLKAITISRELWPDVPQIAVFDTAFHHTIPDRATTYAVPKEWRDKGLRRYGFHGISHKYVGLRVAQELGKPVTDLQIISCHLGNGASVCAINRGFSIDTSMWMTPLEELVMGTRSGDVNPGMFTYLDRKLGLDVKCVLLPMVNSDYYRS